MVERVQKLEAVEKPGIMPGGSREKSLSREENK